MKLVIDTAESTLTCKDGDSETTVGLYTKEAFEAISLQWIRVGYSLSYYHTFTWFGLPILQLPEDLVRMQELIYRLKPRVIVETGVYQGGSMLFYASLLEAMGEGRVIGIDLRIPADVREKIEGHPLSKRISLVEASSSDPATLERIRQMIGPAAPVLVMLDSDHTRKHVAAELELFSQLVTVGSYVVVADGYIKDVWDVPRAEAGWKTDNPFEAASDFARRHPEFVQAQPAWTYSESALTENVTYFPGGWLQRIKS
jgi:cephalosporin hydroxylase